MSKNNKIKRHTKSFIITKFLNVGFAMGNYKSDILLDIKIQARNSFNIFFEMQIYEIICSFCVCWKQINTVNHCTDGDRYTLHTHIQVIKIEIWIPIKFGR